MTSVNKPLAKSLHTHSVLVNVAMHLHTMDPYKHQPANLQPKQAAKLAVETALDILESSEKPDPHNLVDRAIEHVADLIKAERAAK